MGKRIDPIFGAFMNALRGEVQDIPPVWFMRQAGRYLPEYREVRAKAGSFLDLCYNPELASDVTLQPIRRYDLDAAILFADILLIPDAMGQELTFVQGDGPHLSPVITHKNISSFLNRDIHERLAPIYQTVETVRRELAPEKALIGFAGAPWTVATYMLAGGPQKDPAALRSLWYDQKSFVTDLIDALIAATIDYLNRQIDAGADAVQLFDTWAQGLPEDLLRSLSIEPLKRIAEGVKAKHPATPVILFPRGVGAMAAEYARMEACDAIGIDYATPWDWARENLSPHATVQGGLDPLITVAGGEMMEQAARRLIETFRGAPYVFNLGHGFTPQTPPENVSDLVAVIRGER